LEVGVLLAGEEAGAFLSDMREFAVAEDAGFGVVLMEILEELVEGTFLSLGARVVSDAVFVETAFIDDSQ
jgi:hypothetical protein